MSSFFILQSYHAKDTSLIYLLHRLFFQVQQCRWKMLPCKILVTCPAKPGSPGLQPASRDMCGTTAPRSILKLAPKPAQFRAWVTSTHEKPVFAPTAFTPQTCRDVDETQKWATVQKQHSGTLFPAQNLISHWWWGWGGWHLPTSAICLWARTPTQAF